MNFITNTLPSRNINEFTGKYVLPAQIVLKDLTLPTEDQGASSRCAAYTVTSWVENIQWRRTGIPIDYDPIKLYDRAKELDGYPKLDGTTIEACLKAAIDLEYINGSYKDIISFSTINSLARAIHRYGPVPVAFNISESWLKLKKLKLSEKRLGNQLGGHALICVGYDRFGVHLQNSWGMHWGEYGFCLIPWSVVKIQFMGGSIIKNCTNDLE